MAESLGSAVLTLSLDSEPLKAGLEAARKVIEKANFSIKINTSGSEQRFQQLEASAKTLETQLKKLQTTPLNLNTRQLARLGGDFAAAGKELNDYTRAIINGDKPLANNIAALQQQSVAFRTLAANVKIGSAEFTNFTQAAAKASQKQLFAGLEQAAALQKLFSQGRGEGGFDSFRGTEELLAFASKIGQTPAAIALYTQALEQALDVTKVTDSNFAKLTAEIERQTQALRAAFTAARNYNSALGSGRPALPPAQGPAPFTLQPDTPAALQAAARNARRQAKIEGIRTYLSTEGRDTSVLSGTTAFARPNADAIRAEQTLQKDRLKTADITLRSAKAERQLGLRANDTRSKRFGDAAGSAIIGGAFPLLFGQGVGASLGGAAGGALGGAVGGQFGFGLSLVGTALGAQVDLAIQKLGELAKALDDPIANFQQLVTGANLSSKGLERYIQTLIDTGRTAEAEAAIRADLNRSLNPEAVLQLASANDSFSRTAADLQERLGLIVSGPAAAFINWLDQLSQRLFRIPTGTPTEQQALANRGIGAATGLAGVALAGLGVLAAPLTGGASLLPAAIGGGLLATAGTAQVGLGESQQEQIALEKLLKKTKQETLAIDQKRVAIQAQLVALAEQGGKGTEELKLQADLADVEAKRVKAKADFLARDASTESLLAYKLELNALELTGRQLKANDAIRQKDLAEQKRQSAVQVGLDTAQNTIKAQGIAEQVRNTQALAAAEKGVERQTLATIQAVQSGVAEARRREQSLGAQIDAARLRGGDSGEIEAARLVGEQRIAANETRLALEEGRKALIEGSEVLLENIRTGVLEFTRVRSDPQGLNRFLNSQQIQQRAERDFQTLLPSFREAQGRFTQLTGARAPEFSGSTSGVNESIRNFIESVSREFDSTKDLNATYAAANKINSELVSVNAQLAKVTQTLADKNWLVNVAVSGGQAAAYGDVLNGALSA